MYHKTKSNKKLFLGLLLKIMKQKCDKMAIKHEKIMNSPFHAPASSRAKYTKTEEMP